MDRASEPQEPSAVDRQRSFASLARAEARRTWGRRPRVWGTAAAELLLACGAVPAPTLPQLVSSLVAMTPAGMQTRLGEPLFALLCALTCWAPAILGADLLSLGYAGNPRPLREWAPVEIAARAAGRVVPYLGVVALAVMLYTGGVLLETPSTPPTMYTGLDFRPSIPQFPLWWLAWTGVLLASAVPYFALAALLSATARRPRRWLIAPAAVLAVSVLSGALSWGVTWDPETASLTVSWFTQFVTPTAVLAPNLWTGNFLGAALHLALAQRWAIPGVPERLYWVWWCWLASASFLTLALIPGLWTWAIAKRRRRRWGGGRAALPAGGSDIRGAGSQGELPLPEDGTEPTGAGEPECDLPYPPGVPQRLSR